LKKWAEEQADLVPNLWKKPEQQAGYAQYIRLCGGSTRNLPIALHRGRWWSFIDLAKMSDAPETAIVLDDFVMRFELKQVSEQLLLKDNVFITHGSSIPALLQASTRISWPLGIDTRWGAAEYPALSLAGAVVEGLSAAWGAKLEDVVGGNNLRREKDLIVGEANGEPVKVRALKLMKPKTKATANPAGHRTKGHRH
jgi:hypothetical protein